VIRCKALAYCRLFRPDVALIALVSYPVGVLLVRRLGWQDWAIAAAVSLVSTNFIYVINAWADRDIDRVNSPSRPIPAGEVRPAEALRYAVVLLAGSLVYPFFVARDSLTLGLFLLLPCLGVAYSLPPVRLRRFALPSAFVVSLGLVTPVQLGYYMNCSDYELAPIFVCGLLFCLSIVPLKDITDVKGDCQAGHQSFAAWLGARLPWFSVAGLAVSLCVLFAQPVRGFIFLYLLVASISAVAVIVLLHRHPNRIYKSIIWTAVAEGVLLTIAMQIVSAAAGPP